MILVRCIFESIFLKRLNLFDQDLKNMSFHLKRYILIEIVRENDYLDIWSLKY